MDWIAKQNDVHMYDVEPCPCVKFEIIMSRHVCVMAQDMKKMKTKWPTGGHLRLDRETK